MIRKLALAVTIVVMAVGSARAGVIHGSQVLSGGVALSNAGTTDDVNKAKSITFAGDSLGDDLVAYAGNAYQTGDFKANAHGGPFGVYILNSGTLTIDFTVGTGLSFSSASFGTFHSASVTQISNATSAPSYDFLGTFTPGTDFPNTLTAGDANILISLTQSGGPGNAVSFSGTLHSPPSVSTPEPATVFGLISGAAIFALAHSRRRSA